MEQPLKYWVPSIAPSGQAFYSAKLFPKWTGSLFAGALAGKMLVRLQLNGTRRDLEERLLPNLNERIRDVRQGPDGALWLLTDSGRTDPAGVAVGEMRGPALRRRTLVELRSSVVTGKNIMQPPWWIASAWRPRDFGLPLQWRRYTA